MNSTRRAVTDEEVETLIETLREPGDNVAKYKLKLGADFVLGRTRMECIQECRKSFTANWRLFIPEHWVGDLWQGKWVESGY